MRAIHLLSSLTHEPQIGPDSLLILVLVFGLDVLIVFTDCRCRQHCQQQQPSHVEHRGRGNVKDKLEEKRVQFRKEHEDEEEDHLDDAKLRNVYTYKPFEFGKKSNLDEDTGEENELCRWPRIT